MRWIVNSNPSAVGFHHTFTIEAKNTGAGQALDTSHLLAGSIKHMHARTHTPHNVTTAQLTSNCTNPSVA